MLNDALVQVEDEGRKNIPLQSRSEFPQQRSCLADFSANGHFEKLGMEIETHPAVNHSETLLMGCIIPSHVADQGSATVARAGNRQTQPDCF